MTKDIQKIIQVRPQYQVNRGAVKMDSGLAVRYIASATFDTAGNDSAGVSNKTAAAHGLGVYIPTKAIITKVWVDVITTFQSTAGGTDLATIALHVQGAGDITAALAIADGSNIWDAGLHGSVLGTVSLDGNSRTAIAGAAAEAVGLLKLTAEREITATVAVAALTAGKLVVHVEYFISA